MTLNRTNMTSIASLGTTRPVTMLALVCLIALAACTKKSPEAPTSEADDRRSVAGAVSPEAAKLAGIEFATAGPARILSTLTLYGTVRPNAEREQEVRARYPGVVRSVNKRAGDAVSKGEEVLTVESNESLQVYPVRSQFSGRLLDRRTNPGDAVDSSAVLMRIADLSTVWAEFSVFARDLDHVRPGMAVSIQSADEDAKAESRIDYISPSGATDTQSVIARAVINNPDAHWVAGQFVSGDVVTSDVQVTVAVAPGALQELQGKPVVFVQADGRLEAHPVVLGRRGKDAVEVKDGLKAGDRYAATNSYLIKADLLKSEGDED